MVIKRRITQASVSTQVRTWRDQTLMHVNNNTHAWIELMQQGYAAQPEGILTLFGK